MQNSKLSAFADRLEEKKTATILAVISGIALLIQLISDCSTFLNLEYFKLLSWSTFSMVLYLAVFASLIFCAVSGKLKKYALGIFFGLLAFLNFGSLAFSFINIFIGKVDIPKTLLFFIPDHWETIIRMIIFGIATALVFAFSEDNEKLKKILCIVLFVVLGIYLILEIKFFISYCTYLPRYFSLDITIRKILETLFSIMSYFAAFVQIGLAALFSFGYCFRTKNAEILK